jgi:PAS domain S-box-containing protein
MKSPTRRKRAAGPGAVKKAASGDKQKAPGRPGPVARKRLISEDDLARLQDRLQEAQETLDAIRNGEVDAVVVAGSNGSQVYSLAGAEQPYRVYVERMREGAVTVSSNGLILYCNRCFAEMVKTPLERAIGSDLRLSVPPEVWKTISEVFDASEVVEHECHIEDLSGGTLPVKLTASPLPLEDQKVMCLVVTDLTAQQEQEKLRLAKEVAERASLAKDSFLAALSHELRTPLTPALIAAATLENDPTLPDSVRQDIAMIRRNVELETRLIDDLLDLTRIANGKLELHKATVELHALLTRAWEICDSGIKQKFLTLDLRLEAHETHVLGDAVRLQQAIWNLIRNAVKFTPEHGMISIATMNCEGRVRVVIKDSGIGFEPRLASMLFDAFEQTGRDITKRFGGLGLGLAISRSIVLGHGGDIRAESPGLHKGATFTIDLPLEKREGKRFDAIQPPEDEANGTQLRILLVEDHEDTRQTMVRVLQRWGHSVEAAASAHAALNLAAKHPFDLVISDLGLPDESGAGLMSKLRDGFGIQGIAVSGYGMEHDVAESQAAGFAHHLTKPIQIERLRQLLRKVAVPKSQKV